MIPARANLEVALMANKSLWDYYNGFWGDVYGFSMNAMKKKTKGEGQVTQMSAANQASRRVELINWDLAKCSVADLSFSKRDFELVAETGGEIHGLVVSFDCDMVDRKRAKEPVVLSTAATEPPTHWKQTGFLLEKPIEANKGDIFKGTLKMDRNFRNRRELKVHVKLATGGTTICDQEYTVA